tara:strand:+ start:372 stop:656 length:285 start_codon:yes stop_codon:yes gene_type:complete
MKIKKLNKSEYEIETKEDLIYITREKNPDTINLGNNVYIRESLYIYFIDIFEKYKSNEIYWGENFDDLDLAIDYIYDNYQIPTKITDQIKFERN